MAPIKHRTANLSAVARPRRSRAGLEVEISLRADPARTTAAEGLAFALWAERVAIGLAAAHGPLEVILRDADTGRHLGSRTVEGVLS
ncbi:MAG: hypothetical protein JSR82_06640 [Verrucomicrobia bacterium]|nr:hypothetical protein [Verrucomicrobiota bacterium]